mgnify:CR=1 FL=1
MKTALISGITGQDGSYLTELLLEKGYNVHGIIRRSSSLNTFRIDHLYNNPNLLNKKFFLHYGDLTDSSNLNRLVEKIQPAPKHKIVPTLILFSSLSDKFEKIVDNNPLSNSISFFR